MNGKHNNNSRKGLAMRTILSILCVLLSFSAFAQDIIMKQDGTEIQCKLIEVGSESVKYKKWTNLNGPTFIEETNDIFMIKYQNGEKDVFGVKNEIATSSAPLSQAALSNLMFDKNSISGLSANGNEVPLNYAQSLMGEKWNEFEFYKDKRTKGKHLLATGIVIRFLSLGTSAASIGSGEAWLLFTSIGLRSMGTPFLATGIVNLVKGNKNCKRVVKEVSAPSVGFNPEFDFGFGINSMTLRMSF